MPTTRTYYCGESGIAKRLDNLTTPWTLITVPVTNITLNDIKTDPITSDKVYTVGQSNKIYVSSNAGALWTVPGGTYGSPTTEWFEVWPISALIIVVCGSNGVVAKSIDGGLTFNNIPILPTPTGLQVPGTAARAIHFSTLLIGVVGFEDKVFLTTDGGTSWTPGNGGLSLIGTVPSFSSLINGIHIDQTGQIIVVHSNTNIWYSNDAGASFTAVYTYTLGNGRHLTWYNDATLWGIGDFTEIAASINGGVFWSLVQTDAPNPSTNKAAHFYGPINGFYSSDTFVNITADGGATGTLSDNAPVPNITAVWTQIPRGALGVPGPQGPAADVKYFKLINCDGVSPDVIVNDNLTAYVGLFIKVNGQCVQVQTSLTGQGAVTLYPTGVPVLTSYTSCLNCNPPNCFQLTDCTGETPAIITSTDMSQYIGRAVKLCNFTSNPIIPIVQATTFGCLLGSSKGFATQITTPTTGFYYKSGTTTILPYSNPSMFTVYPGSGLCVGPITPFNILSVSPQPTYTIQFLLGATPLTNLIPISTGMSVANIQALINLNIVSPITTVTVNSFLPAGLNVTVLIQGTVTETTLTVSLIPQGQAEILVTQPITGECICYTVTEIPPCTAPGTPGTPPDVIDNQQPIIGVLIPGDFPGSGAPVIPGPIGPVSPPPMVPPIIIDGCFDDCTCCLPQTPELLTYYIPTPPEIDKHTYRIVESQCDIDVNKVFANAMYTIFKRDHYGMESCCVQNLDKIWIEKELSDLSKLKC